MRVILLAALLLASIAFAGDLCIEESAGLCCFPCDVVYELGGTGYSTEGGATACSNEFGTFTISASNTDPFVNEGPLPPFTSLYLWLLAGAPVGYGFDWGHATIDGDLQILDYEPYPVDGGSSWNPATNELFVSLNCGFGNHLLGAFTVLAVPTGVESSVEVESWGRVKARWREPRP